jgi:PAS domain S-box-containing protein
MEEDDELDDASMESVETMDETQILSSLLRISELMSSATDIDELLHLIVELTTKMINSNVCSIFLWDPDNNVFVPRITYDKGLENRDNHLAAFYSIRPTPEDIPELARKLMDEKIPIVVRNADKSTIIPKQLVELFDIKSALIVPLICGDQFIGVMAINYTVIPHHFSENEIKVAMSLASQAALAIRNAQLISSLTEERNRSRRIIETMAEGLLVISPDRKVVMTNRMIESIVGSEEENLAGTSCRDLFKGGIVMDGINLCETDCPLSAKGEKLAKASLEGVITVKEGKKTWLSLNYAPVLDVDGKLIYAVVTIRDVTERKELKKEIAHLDRKLLVDKMLEEEKDEHIGGI